IFASTNARSEARLKSHARSTHRNRRAKLNRIRTFAIYALTTVRRNEVRGELSATIYREPWNFLTFAYLAAVGPSRSHGWKSPLCTSGQTMVQVTRSGGTGKAEAAKMRGAGIGPKQCPGKCEEEKGRLIQFN